MGHKEADTTERLTHDRPPVSLLPPLGVGLKAFVGLWVQPHGDRGRAPEPTLLPITPHVLHPLLAESAGPC